MKYAIHDLFHIHNSIDEILIHIKFSKYSRHIFHIFIHIKMVQQNFIFTSVNINKCTENILHSWIFF